MVSGLASCASSPWQAGTGDGLHVDWAVLGPALLKLETTSCPACWFSQTHLLCTFVA